MVGLVLRLQRVEIKSGVLAMATMRFIWEMSDCQMLRHDVSVKEDLALSVLVTCPKLLTFECLKAIDTSESNRV